MNSTIINLFSLSFLNNKEKQLSAVVSGQDDGKWKMPLALSLDELF